MNRILRVATSAEALNILLKGQFKFIKSEFDIIAVANGRTGLAKLTHREGVHSINIAFRRRPHILFDIIALVQLLIIIVKYKPEIVHSHTPKAGLLLMIAGYVTRVPHRLHSFTGLIFPTMQSKAKQKFYRFVDILICKLATQVYPESYGVKSLLEINNITNRMLKVIANGNINGIDTTYFNPDLVCEMKVRQIRELYCLQGKLVLVYIGRINRDKGINELVKLVENLGEEFDLRLLILGEYEKENEISKLTKSIIEKSENISYVGFQDDIRPFLKVSHCLVHLSYREGHPNVLLQASAMNVPIISSNIVGSNEIVIHGVNGWLLSSFDEDKLYHEVKTIIESKELLKPRNTRQYIIENFDQNIVHNAWKEEYNLLIRET